MELSDIFVIIVGIILLLIQLLVLYFIIAGIKKIIVCTKEVAAKVTSVIDEQKRYEDSKTGKTEYRYYYNVTFKYDYNGQEYNTTRTYRDRCIYSKGDNPTIKINPHNPKETGGLKGDISTLLGLSLSIPLFAFFDLIYISILSNVF
ncbi:DUF3592 domain-containing protein [Eubacterium ruminantium]|uniref:DUF3592 domain-containing protein n=1 Tax=Eubacterium ruminantium TaxID=42322 RepID=UPI00247972D1|nr:DUF3592 domain-containing protein [Eubacterium ruminantium]